MVASTVIATIIFSAETMSLSFTRSIKIIDCANLSNVLLCIYIPFCGCVCSVFPCTLHGLFISMPVCVLSEQNSLNETLGNDEYTSARKEVLTNMCSRPMQVSA